MLGIGNPIGELQQRPKTGTAFPDCIPDSRG